MKALSIRQPWAWLILHGGKDIENRTWRTNVRGTILVHAAKGMTKQEYYDVAQMVGPDFRLPAYEALQRGGIVGKVEIVDCVTHSISPWFFGPCGFVLRNPQSTEFRPYRGELGFFDVTEERL